MRVRSVPASAEASQPRSAALVAQAARRDDGGRHAKRRFAMVLAATAAAAGCYATLNLRSVQHSGATPAQQLYQFVSIGGNGADRQYPHQCIVDELMGHDALHPGELMPARQMERYIVYSPQFGLGNQQITLRDAVVWALLLNRTLVVPHIVGHSGCSNQTLCAASSTEMAPHELAFSLHSVGPLRVISMTQFLELELKPRRLLVLPIKVLWAFRMEDHYWDMIGVQWHREHQPVKVPMPNLELKTIQDAFSACHHHEVLAFRSLFAAVEFRSGHYPPPGKRWLDTVAMPALYKPSDRFNTAASVLFEAFQQHNAIPKMSGPAKATSARLNGVSRAPSASACVHIRRGDIVEDCARYEAESRQPTGRAWVKSHFRNGYSCYQTPKDLAANLNALITRGASNAVDGSHLPIFAAVEDRSVLDHRELDPFNISTLGELLDTSLGYSARKQLTKIPDGLARVRAPLASYMSILILNMYLLQPPHQVLLDQLVCAKASHLVLNKFSTFSQMMQGRIGLDHPSSVGWTRELTTAQLSKLKVDVQYWTRPQLLMNRE